MSKTSFCIRRYTQKISQKRQADFVPKNNFFEFNFKFFQLISRIAIDTKSLPPPHMLVFLWTTLKENFFRHNLQNHGCGNDSLTMHFLFEQTVKQTERC